jgi:hypothetical protein
MDGSRRRKDRKMTSGSNPNRRRGIQKEESCSQWRSTTQIKQPSTPSSYRYFAQQAAVNGMM